MKTKVFHLFIKWMQGSVPKPCSQCHCCSQCHRKASPRDKKQVPSITCSVWTPRLKRTIATLFFESWAKLRNRLKWQTHLVKSPKSSWRIMAFGNHLSEPNLNQWPISKMLCILLLALCAPAPRAIVPMRIPAYKYLKKKTWLIMFSKTPVCQMPLLSLLYFH